ncbi:methyltransferase [Microbacterium fluvii]|uniref:Methyltransferase n=1 Tax=Microbacterium fluvii TaxID=415215 RepID=A0ABW2HGJ3_9MICO|nr:methyltransferase [Microbacterium fluvii]MCU4672527.1 methyltransferase [Microbacterium fluvii]
MSTTETHHALWLAYGSGGAVAGTIRKSEEGYTVTMAGADASTGTYPTMEVAKSALHAHMPPGSDWPRFQEH